MNQKLRNSI